MYEYIFFFSSRRRHTRCSRDWSSDVCSFVPSRRRHTRCSRDWSSDVCSSDLGAKCEVIAPTLVPVKSGERVKTDRRDALKLARNYRAGELTAVWVPDRSEERRVGKECRSRWAPYH